MSQSVVWCITQDSKGFMWFGTQDGLNKYDGYKFKIYLPSDETGSISDLDILSMHEDKSGDLWIGTNKGTLSRYDRDGDNFKNILFDFGNAGTKNSVFISSIIDSGKDQLLIGTFGSGIIKLNKKTFKYDFIKSVRNDPDSLQSDYVNRLFLYKDKIIAGTWDKGICILDAENGKYVNCVNDIDIPDHESKNRIRCISQDSDEKILVGTNKGIYILDIQNNRFCNFSEYHKIGEDLKDEMILSVCEDKNQNLWIGTRYSGVAFIDKKNGESRMFSYDSKNNFSLANDAVFSIYNDKSNVTWFGTYGGGLCKLDCESKKFYHIPETGDPEKNIFTGNINSFAEDDSGNFWIGSIGMGLFKTDGAFKESVNYSYEPENENSIHGKSVTALLSEGNDLWIGLGRGGLNRLKKDGDNFERFTQEGSSEISIYSIVPDGTDPPKSLFAGTSSNGVLKFKIKEKQFLPLDISDGVKVKCKFAKSLLLDSFNNLWVGSRGEGLFRVNFKKKKVVRYKFDKKVKTGINEDNIIVIYQDRSNNIWIGTHGRGINKYDYGTDSFRSYSSEDGLINNSIRGILEDQSGNIWISTNNGLSRFNPESGIFRNYDVSDGLQSKEFNDGSCFKSGNGTMYFGGVNGFNYFKPEEIKDNPYIPKTVITDFQIFNRSVKNAPGNNFLQKSIAETGEIPLSYKESVFSFEFASLIYNDTEKNQYAYKMEGFDKEWIYCGTRRFATYTNLEPAEYIFRVKGSNNDGIWDEKGTSIKIKITPPFWKTRWFKTLGALSIAGATGLTYRQKLSKIEKEKKLQEEFSRRLLDSQESDRKKIATELHGTIAHDILITKNKAVIGLKNLEDPDKIRNVLNEISELASGTLNDVRNISYELHPHLIERLGLTKAIRSIVNRVSKSSEIKFSSSIDNVDKFLSKELEINVFRIVQECLNNILRHSGASEVILKMLRTNNLLTVIISDNGRGFSKDMEHGIGLSDITERIKLYKGSLNIESEAGRGTKFTISIPLN